MNGCKSMGDSIVYNQLKVLFEVPIGRWGNGDEKLGIVEKDAWDAVIVQIRSNDRFTSPVGLPDASRTMTPPSTFSGRGEMSSRTFEFTQIA
jgi:hypothetical protein